MLSNDQKVAVGVAVIGAVGTIVAAFVPITFGNSASPPTTGGSFTASATPPGNGAGASSAGASQSPDGGATLTSAPATTAGPLTTRPPQHSTQDHGGSTQMAPIQDPAAGSGTITETAEWSANIFSDQSMSQVIGRTNAGAPYAVKCRVPPDPSSQPSSVSDGGWYELASGGYVAANTFDNGALPNNNPYDPAVSPCE